MAKVTLDDQEAEVGAEDVVVVTPGVTHNLINAGEESLKLYTIYAPANHIDGRVHLTKDDAEADVEDENFGKV